MIKFIINKEQYLVDAILENSDLSFSTVQKKLQAKEVLVNKNRVNVNFILPKNAEVVVFANEKSASFKIVFEDDNFLIIVKPQKIESIELTEKYYKKYFLCHRLDRNTEGLIIMAKNKDYLNLMIKAFKNNEIKKFYLAYVFGKPNFTQKNCIAFLHKNEEESFVKIYDNHIADTVKIETKINMLGYNAQENSSLLKVEISQGKTHQIRAHLAYLNLPIIGDEKYGNKEINKRFKFKQQNLFANEIVFKCTGALEYLNKLEIKYSPAEVKFEYFK